MQFGEKLDYCAKGQGFLRKILQSSSGLQGGLWFIMKTDSVFQGKQD